MLLKPFLIKLLDFSQVCHFLGHLDLDQYTPVKCYYALFTDPPSVSC